ncbi:hypothetical protein [Flavobacterium caeni]|uniref:Uncharacterized protein n=1 Tax=Flavobacterium caeni TaxID=490189 RepID=A0A1G5K6J5_9FLAO|nr:hypothetical protein [Flavobacterium caeni]SCY96157.1 hypothetical protein SAMN02927903_03106 [Flavobacterium caeni]
MKNYWDIIIINLTTILLALWTNYYFDGKPEMPIAILATGISASFGIRQYKIENDKMFKELFQAFNEKYDIKFNNVLNLIVEKYQNDANYQLDNDEKALLVDYINLCAEEYLWYKKGRIDADVWSAWENGMRYYFQLKPISICVEIEKTQKESYYGLFEKLNL